MRTLLLCLALIGLAAATAQTPPSAPTRDQIEAQLRELNNQITKLNQKGLWQDAAVFAKAVTWGLRYDKDLTPADYSLMQRALARGNERAAELKGERSPWKTKTGRVTRAYASKVDDSIQPYGLIIPASYDGKKSVRLDVVLHGSTRPVGMSELRFMMPFDEGDTGGKAPTDREYIELHPLGRVENCYRWAGETDVFEAIEDVCRNYNIDRDRIVLRGMSMGASGTWHLGLKHPDKFVALGPYCGYVDTHRFSETPGMNFVKVGPLPSVQEDGLHMLDSVDYAANAGVVPAIAAIGEKDPFFQAHVIMEEAMEKEGLKMVNLVSRGTAHVQDPKTWAEQMGRINSYAGNKLDRRPRHIRFVTWTLKYNQCHWIQVLGLERHYQRAEIDAVAKEDRTVELPEPTNITCFSLSNYPHSVRIGSEEIHVSYPRNRVGAPVFQKFRGRWHFAGFSDRKLLEGKRPGLQGPIDDAFTTRFLCVRGTGKAWNPAIDAWAQANLKRFQYEWARYYRGDLPVKDDTAVTEEDRKSRNLILFGDPGSNKLMREAIDRTPVKWSQNEMQVGNTKYASANYAPAFIQPSPWSQEHYVVINSGHTFHEAELNRLNYLLFPRMGDWAVLRIGNGIIDNPSSPLPEEVVKAGWFNEKWGL